MVREYAAQLSVGMPGRRYRRRLTFSAQLCRPTRHARASGSRLRSAVPEMAPAGATGAGVASVDRLRDAGFATHGPFCKARHADSRRTEGNADAGEVAQSRRPSGSRGRPGAGRRGRAHVFDHASRRGAGGDGRCLLRTSLAKAPWHRHRDRRDRLNGLCGTPVRFRSLSMTLENRQVAMCRTSLAQPSRAAFPSRNANQA